MEGKRSKQKVARSETQESRQMTDATNSSLQPVRKSKRANAGNWSTFMNKNKKQNTNPQPAADTKEVDSQPQVHDQLNHESRCSSSSSLGQLCLSSAEVTVITSEPSMPAEKAKTIYVPAEKAKTIYVPAEDEKLASIPSDKEKSIAPPVAALIEKEKAYIFKDPNFVHSVRGCMTGGKKTRAWKSLKQIISAEKASQWHPDAPIYGAIDSPPSMKPAKKYSDVSGLPGKYRDPQTKLMFYSSLEFNHIRCLPGDIVGGYLSLRKADNPAGWYRP